MRYPERRLRLRFCLYLAATVATVPALGCGNGEEPVKATDSVRTNTPAQSDNPYVTALRQFREAVVAKTSYDAYGYAEYFPATQRAAIDAFCFVADRVAKAPAQEGLDDPTALTTTIVRKAEADLKSERDIIAPGPAHRAIAKLQAVLGLETLDPEPAEHYVRACYR